MRIISLIGLAVFTLVAQAQTPGLGSNIGNGLVRAPSWSNQTQNTARTSSGGIGGQLKMFTSGIRSFLLPNNYPPKNLGPTFTSSAGIGTGVGAGAGGRVSIPSPRFVRKGVEHAASVDPNFWVKNGRYGTWDKTRVIAVRVDGIGQFRSGLRR